MTDVAHLPVKLIFEGDNFLMKTEKKAEKLYWYWLYSTLLKFKDTFLTT
jgi:hypothetical protein